jgi:hypothetical protein
VFGLGTVALGSNSIDEEMVMKRTNYKRTIMSGAMILAAMFGVSVTASPVTAAPPVVEDDHGAFVRILGNPSDGTVKFQYGWYEDSPASDAVGYWIGLYDVTNSRYVWSPNEENPEPMFDGMDELFMNARPTTNLPNGEYKVVFFVRNSYEGEVTNIASIEVPFTVDRSDD